VFPKRERRVRNNHRRQAGGRGKKGSVAAGKPPTMGNYHTFREQNSTLCDSPSIHISGTFP
jgi:hypothetical protein